MPYCMYLRKFRADLEAEARGDGETLARGDTIDQGMVAQAFKLSDTKIITPAKTYDPNNEIDEEYFEFSLFMARREYKAIKRRMQVGRAPLSGKATTSAASALWVCCHQVQGGKGLHPPADSR